MSKFLEGLELYYIFLFRFMPIIEPIIPDNNRDMYDIINLIVNGFFVIIEIIIDNIIYIDVNFIPSR